MHERYFGKEEYAFLKTTNNLENMIFFIVIQMKFDGSPVNENRHIQRSFWVFWDQHFKHACGISPHPVFSYSAGVKEFNLLPIPSPQG